MSKTQESTSTPVHDVAPRLKFEYSRVTDRRMDEVLELIVQEVSDFKAGQKAVIAGSGFHLNFEAELHDLGLEIAIIDQSLGFTSLDYRVKIEEHGTTENDLYQVATYASKDELKRRSLQDNFTKLRDDEFDGIKKQRLTKANDMCFAVISERVPSSALEELKDVDWFIDCIGPGHYIDRSEIRQYLQQVVGCLKRDTGVAIIYPIHNRKEPWLEALSAQENIVWEEYIPSGLAASGAKIRRVR